MIASDETARRGAEARRLIRQGGHAALATSFAGQPYASLAAVACDLDATPLLLLSDLAQHTRNLLAEPRASLLFDGTRDYPDRLAGPRLTVLGRVERRDEPSLLARFTAAHRDSAAYAGFGDFHLYRVAIERGHLVAGFGQIFWIEGQDLRFALEASALAEAETEIVAHMNADHRDTLALYAERLLRRPGAEWRMAGIDPEGIDLRRPSDAGREHARLEFADPVLTPAAARAALIALADRARAASTP